jgi:flagellar biosynthesis GTPase FlhF
VSSRLGVGLLLAAVLAVGAGAWRTSRQAAALESELNRRHAREQQLQQRLAEAQAEEDRRLDAIEAARRAHEEAVQAAEHDRAETEAALSDKQAADQDRREAALAAERAHKLAVEAERRAREEREKREREWSRLAAALGKVAPTQRSGWELTVDLGAGLDLERRSRLAGVLLANQGYWAVIEDGGDAARAEELRRYIVSAGVPSEVLHQTAGKRHRLTISDTILNDPPPKP